MFHPSVYVGHHPRISVDVPFTTFEKKIESIVDRVIHAVQAIFTAIRQLFWAANTQKSSLGSYKVSCHKTAYVSNAKSPYVIVALDGGGVRGKASLAALKLIEKELGTHLIKAVDCIAGVSTGGIIAAALSCPSASDPTAPRYTAEDVDDLYDNLAERVFSRSLWDKVSSLWGVYTSKYQAPVEVIKGVIGDLPFCASIAKKLLVTSLDLISGQMVYFENCAQEATSEAFLKSKNIRCFRESEGATFCDALLATSAAPTYFPTVPYKNYNLTDGGVADNNPAQLATLLAMNSEAKDRPILVISIGTGRAKHERITTKDQLSWGIVQWISPLIDYFLDSKEDQADVEMNLLAASNRQVDYVRFQMTLENDEEAQMDNASPANMKRLEELGTTCFQHFLDNGGRERIIEPLKAKLQAR